MRTCGRPVLNPAPASSTPPPRSRPPRRAEHLGLAAGEAAYQVRRLRLANGAPVSVDESWLPPGPLPGLLSEDLTGSLYRVLAASGHPVQHVEQTVEAAAAPEETAALLDIEPGAPVLLFRRRSFTGKDDPGTPIEYAVSTYRSDRYQVSMRLALG